MKIIQRYPAKTLQPNQYESLNNVEVNTKEEEKLKGIRNTETNRRSQTVKWERDFQHLNNYTKRKWSKYTNQKTQTARVYKENTT